MERRAFRCESSRALYHELGGEGKKIEELELAAVMERVWDSPACGSAVGFGRQGEGYVGLAWGGGSS